MRKSEYQEWFRKADQDEISMKALVAKKQGHPNTVCFLGQQMSEKYLKGLLVFHGEDLLKIHDLLKLETLLLKLAPDIEKLHKYLVFLNGFYTGTRYPGDCPDFDWKVAQDAFDKAEKIKLFVLSKIHG
ncbi:HEPN domain-containing protein [Candidatus Peregrinibacteria bacterium]|nr:HEPN domain-containing protein [Candidatus Peregrinibacteria bacterium]